MNRELVWTPVQWPGCEHLDVRPDGDGRFIADGVVVGVVDGLPVRLRYQVICDTAWRTERVTVDLHGEPPVALNRDGDRWVDAGGAERTDLASCIDVDIALTPFTNTLPIRRLDLAPGDSADLRVLYVTFEPTLRVSTIDQRYTRLEPGAGASYRYQSGSFIADLQVDADGIVTEYPGLWNLVT